MYIMFCRCILAGYDNGDVKMFDLRAGKVRWETNVRNGVCGTEFDRKEIQMNKFCVTTLESQVRCPFLVDDAPTYLCTHRASDPPRLTPPHSLKSRQAHAGSRTVHLQPRQHCQPAPR